MEAKVVTRAFQVVGIKHTGKFAEYGSLVPQVAQQFLARVSEIPHHTEVEVTVYEQPRGSDHVEGYFYTGIVVTDEPASLPAGMEFFKVGSTYAVVRGDERQMGELYGFLVGWIAEQGLVTDRPDGLIIEVFDAPGTGEVEIYVPLKA